MDEENIQSIIYINRLRIISQHQLKEAASLFVVPEVAQESSCAFVGATHSHLATDACPPKLTS